MSLDVEALETSFDLVAPRRVDGRVLPRLFAAAPAVRPLFPTDMKRQKVMLLGALVLLRKSPATSSPWSHAAGSRRAHVAYGARPEHYPVVGATESHRWRPIAGDQWKPEYEEACEQRVRRGGLRDARGRGGQSSPQSLTPRSTGRRRPPHGRPPSRKRRLRDRGGGGTGDRRPSGRRRGRQGRTFRRRRCRRRPSRACEAGACAGC